MIAFHGFGESAEMFEVIEPSLGKIYSIVSVDLPFHGLTEWTAGEKFTPRQANDLVELLMKKYGIDKISFASYSIGGKIALKLFEMNPERVETIWLFAPDGLKNNIWYNLAVYPAWGRKLFRYVIDHPQATVNLLKLLHLLRIFPKNLTAFLQSQLLDVNMRERIWNTWLGIAGFEVLPSRLKNLFRQDETACYIFMGQFDPVIKTKVGRRFAKGLSNVRLEIIPKGHALMKSYLNSYIEKYLQR